MGCMDSILSCRYTQVVAVFTRKQRLLLSLIPPLVATLIRLLGVTLRYRDINDAGVPVGIEVPGPTVFAFWHRSLLVCAHRFRNRDIAILISRSFDGELIARIVEQLGFRAVRGSSSRGGTAALRQMIDAYNEGHRCAFTADGPRGPAMVAQPGPVHLAQLVNAAWVGAFYALPVRAWQLKSWDRFLIPKPFSEVVMTWPTHVHAGELSLVRLQQALDRAVEMANVN